LNRQLLFVEAASRYNDMIASRSTVLRGIVVDVVVVDAPVKLDAAAEAVLPLPILMEIEDGTPAAAVNVICTM
jgi:hypothetical protein